MELGFCIYAQTKNREPVTHNRNTQLVSSPQHSTPMGSCVYPIVLVFYRHATPLESGFSSSSPFRGFKSPEGFYELPGVIAPRSHKPNKTNHFPPRLVPKDEREGAGGEGNTDLRRGAGGDGNTRNKELRTKPVPIYRENKEQDFGSRLLISQQPLRSSRPPHTSSLQHKPLQGFFRYSHRSDSIPLPADLR